MFFCFYFRCLLIGEKYGSSSFRKKLKLTRISFDTAGTYRIVARGKYCQFEKEVEVQVLSKYYDNTIETVFTWALKAHHFLVQSEVRRKPIALSYTFQSGLLRRLHVFGSNLYWFIRLSALFVIWLTGVIHFVSLFPHGVKNRSEILSITTSLWDTPDSARRTRLSPLDSKLPVLKTAKFWAPKDQHNKTSTMISKSWWSDYCRVSFNRLVARVELCSLTFALSL